jgi:hypothetical protein
MVVSYRFHVSIFVTVDCHIYSATPTLFSIYAKFACALTQHTLYQDATSHANMTISHQMQALQATIEHPNHPGCDTVTSDSNPPDGGVHIIPEIPRKLREHAWEQVIRDWDEKDLNRSHYIALKDWHRDWYQWNKPEGVKYCQRRMIALEFIER